MRIGILGLGLIGGSAALALAEAGHEVTGYDTAPETRAAAAATSIEVADEPAGLRKADVAVVAVPIAAASRTASLFGPDRFDGIVTDAASVKGRMREAFADHPRFIGGHPMAGKETAGFDAAEPGLFRGRRWVLCLEDETELGDWIALARLWTSIGAHVVPATAAAHDRAAARISHVEHLAAAALTLIADEPLSRTLAAGSFHDGTRVAASPNRLFEGMVEGNRAEMTEALEHLAVELEDARLGLYSFGEQPDRIVSWFDRARRLRASWPPEPGEPQALEITREGLLELGTAGGWVESIGDSEVATVRRPRVKSNP
ncbi:prephenate dehydrogenase/arogenate dehydrogenase family protein [Glycomyces xiaoerkulensis]|uniref:prephenate dehydrogenase/arogenate dehydrogenase family protein n=1 Tax=Glycomyces xiaoerkulensis TaxID=2038139 RepID=UPI0012FFDFFC|nr:prephenate dehydrogenase/arogenate dehydrogenase family protein [Glycomyces xiaoerkulensis]